MDDRLPTCVRPNADTSIHSSHRPSPRRHRDDGNHRLRGRAADRGSARHTDGLTHGNCDTNRHTHPYGNPNRNPHGHPHAHANPNGHANTHANPDSPTHGDGGSDTHTHAT